MSHMINGRTYRDVLTTNNLPEPAKVEPVKLNQITTGIIPNAEPRPEPKGDGFKKMITTHDETGPKFKVVIEESKPGEPNLADAIGKQFDADAKAYADKQAGDNASKKKAGRPKKAE